MCQVARSSSRTAHPERGKVVKPKSNIRHLGQFSRYWLVRTANRVRCKLSLNVNKAHKRRSSKEADGIKTEQIWPLATWTYTHTLPRLLLGQEIPQPGKSAEGVIQDPRYAELLNKGNARLMYYLLQTCVHNVYPQSAISPGVFGYRRRSGRLEARAW